MSLVADINGVINGAFTIPANVPAGQKLVAAAGNSGSVSSALFVGEGVVTNTVTRTLVPVTDKFYDPVAETFTLTEPKQVTAIDLYVSAKGTKPIRVQLRTTNFGVPTRTILAESIVPASGLTVGAWNRFAFQAPIALAINVEYAIVVLSDESVPALGVAELGKYDAAGQKWVTSQPYEVGVMLTSSNASTWTPDQTRDLAFRIIGMAYSTHARVVALGTIAVINATDLLLKGFIDSPVSGAGGNFRLTLPDGTVINVGQAQSVTLPHAVTGNITVEAVLTATDSLSGVLYPGTSVGYGVVQSCGDYVTRAIDGNVAGCSLRVVFDAIIPSGASVKVYYRDADLVDDWTEMTAAVAARPLGDGVFEYNYLAAGLDIARLQVYLLLTGVPSARPRVRNLRCTAY